VSVRQRASLSILGHLSVLSLAQLVKSVKRRCPRDNSNDSSESSIERAEQFESEVKTWLLELPKAFRFDINNTETTAKVPISPNLQAQRCELAIIANQLILKVFLPYLKNYTGPSSDGLPRRVVSSVIDAGHTVFQAMRILHSTWRQTQPAAFLFCSLGGNNLYVFVRGGQPAYDCFAPLVIMIIRTPLMIPAPKGRNPLAKTLQNRVTKTNLVDNIQRPSGGTRLVLSKLPSISHVKDT
jgi:hypothetical protein